MSSINWQQTMLAPFATMADAIRVIDSSQLKIAFVCDEAGLLKGTVTDGDVRRSLIKGMGQDSSIVPIMNSRPITIGIDADRDVILNLMRNKKIVHLPIVDDSGILIGLETLEHLTEQEKLENPVFLMAGGFGKRLYPLTHDVPKPLLKVGSKPILQTIIEQFLHYGFSRFFMSTHYKAEMVADYFGDGSSWGASIEYIQETQPLGTAGGLGLLKEQDRQQSMIVMNGDLLTKLNFTQLLKFHESANAVATMCTREYSYTIPYGVVGISNGIITGIEEKPVRQQAVNAGIYVLGPEMLAKIPRNTRVDMTTLLQSNIDAGQRVTTFPIHEYWLDIGRMEDLERANHDMAIEF
ncbi:MAG: dTDP-glucose pyrophosphorylase [Parasphingorhabdus sp.]|jgi:dTDP-glucose pyrophosphorylase